MEKQDLTVSCDEAAAFTNGQDLDLSHHSTARVVRKIDMFFMPTMMLGYGLIYYDKAILGSAVLFGMNKDLSLAVITSNGKTDTSRLSWATSMFYFGMLAGLYPNTLLLQRFRMGRVLGPLVLLWGAIAMLTAAVTSWQGLYAQRFFLGYVESVIPTAFMIIVGSYYTQKEQALRQSLWFSSTTTFTIIGGALNYGFGQITGGSLKRWQYIYLLAGALTMIFGVFCFAIPDSPMTAWFLTETERKIAVERLRSGQAGVRSHKIKLEHVWDCIIDVKFWLIALMMLTAYTVNGAVSGFGPLIVSTFGWSTLDSILFQFPLAVFGFLSVIVTGIISSKVRNLLIIQLIICTVPVVAGCIIIWKSSWTHQAAAPIIGYTLIGSFAGVVSLIIIIGMANVAGQTKKSIMAATIFVAYCVGNIVGPQLIKSQTKTRHYPELWLGLVIFYCVCIVTSMLLYVHLWLENKRRDALMAPMEKKENFDFMDLTDNENPYFRYVL